MNQTKPINYQDARKQMAPGDLIAFSGNGLVSRIIRWRTRSKISHVGVVSRINEGANRVMVHESTSLRGTKGVQTNRLSQRIQEYNGKVYWYPLSPKSRRCLDLQRFWEFLWEQDGKPYDFWQAPMSATLFCAREDFGKLFCSELVAGAWEAGGLLKRVNASEKTPDDLCKMNLFNSPRKLIY